MKALSKVLADAFLFVEMYESFVYKETAIETIIIYSFNQCRIMNYNL